MTTLPAREATTPAVPAVSVIVVNYNGLVFLAPLLQSLASAFVRYSSEIIVVDNGSRDGSCEWLRLQPGIRLVALGVNTGFTGGNNIGARHARGDVMLLLNADTRVERSLDGLIDVAMRADVGAAGCQLRYADGRLQYSVGLEHSVLRIALSWLGLEKRSGVPSLFRKFEIDPAFYAYSREGVAWVSGACLATRRDVWADLGGLDTALFMYCEDVDYCHRARANGWQIVYAAEPIVTHYEGHGKAWIGTPALLRTARAYQIYTAKTRGRFAARALCSLLALIFAARGVAFRLRARAATPSGENDWRSDRSSGYWRAARSLFGAAITGRTPAIP